MTENIEVFGQNSIRVRSEIGPIYIDPFQMKEEPRDAAFILITHDHYDHFSEDDIAKVVGDNTRLIVPEKMLNKTKSVAHLMKDVKTVTPGVSYEVDGLEFETVPAYNKLKPFHPKNAEWVGYILNIDDKRIYIAGDTDATPEAKEVKCDVALVPIGGTYTMDAKKAAELINEMCPKVAVPVHYGTAVGSPKDGEVFDANVKDPVKVELKIQF